VGVSVVAPAHNEEGNIRRLIDEITAALAGSSFEIVIVDDGSIDSTRALVQAAALTQSNVRCVAMLHTPQGKGNGQSAAFYAGFRASRGELIAVLDADLQNDPSEIPAMIDMLHRERAAMVQGDRSHARKDNIIRKFGSWVGRKFRLWLLGDTIRDTGCSLRVMRREVALAIPLQFRGMHRFIPVSARHLGYKVVEMRVTHRPRIAGETKYGLGIVQRALPGLRDLLAVAWMRDRRRPTECIEVTLSESDRSGGGT
jgi:dolichol-phosphate mannosyltransferase